MIVQVNFFTSMHMYLDLMSDMEPLICGFIVIKSDVGGMTYPG